MNLNEMNRVGVEIDQAIRDLSIKLSREQKNRDRKINELNGRNSLFGDTRRDAVLFEVDIDTSPDVIRAALYPFEVRMKALRKQISNLQIQRARAILEAGRQMVIK